VTHFVLTDRKMANRITELGIDTEWNARVFSESTIDNLFEEFEKLWPYLRKIPYPLGLGPAVMKRGADTPV
jgi:hypothetical protein